MKKILFLNILLAVFATNWYTNAQELVPLKCPTGINKHGFKDNNTGEIVISCSYDRVWNFSEEIVGLAKVQQNTAKGGVRADIKYGFIDKNGKEVIPLKYDDIKKFSQQIEGLALVKIGNKHGFIDKTGKEVIPVKYSNHEFKFSEGLAVVMDGSLYGFIDKTGKEIIPCRYNFASNFSNEISEVTTRDNKNGFIDIAGNFYNNRNSANKEVAARKARGEYNNVQSQIDQANEADKQRIAQAKNKEREANEARERAARESREREEKMLTFSFFAKNFVESKISEWQKKGEFEPTADWQKRVTENSRTAKAREFRIEAERVYISERSQNFKVGNMTLGTYDPDNQTYLIRNNIHGDWLVFVPINEAPNFKDNWNNIKKTPKYAVMDDKITIAGMDFTISGGKTYKYSNQASLSYTTANIDYNFSPIDMNFASSNQSSTQGRQNISTADFSVGNQSDVARNIPNTGTRNNNTFAIIIANENYESVTKVDFAKNDGETFKKYCIQTLGIPESRVHLVVNATLNNIRREINWLNDVVESRKGEETNIIFYYAGHGIPDESSKSSYLLPVDGLGSDFRTGYKLDDLYQELGQMGAKSVTVFMDACFSGAQRSGEMLASARAVAIGVAPGAPVGNMVVFSAAQGDQTAFPYREKGHGLFTYFLLKKLQETKGDVTLSELGNYIETNVRQQSIEVNKKSQTPTVTPAVAMSEKWKGMKLK